MNCSTPGCDITARFAVFAAYDDPANGSLPGSDIRPVVRRYPMAMAAVCAGHLVPKLDRDQAACGATGAYVVRPL